MNADSTPEPVPCSPGTLRKAIQIYLEHAYEGPAPAYALRHVPPEGDLDVALWLMSDAVERTPSSAGFAETRSFALRLGSVH